MKQASFPHNEMERILALADLNVDYSNVNDTFKDLVKLAAKVTGSPISMINLIDNYTTWTICSYGFDVQQTPREESICQYTILQREHLEIADLTVSPIFKEENFVTGDPHFRFYAGVPLPVNDQNIGSLCVVDRQAKSLSAEKIELLKIIAQEIVNRLKVFQYIDSLRNNIVDVKQTQNKIVHDIRGPLAGIMSLAEIISMQGEDNNLEEVLDFISMIYKGAKSVLDLADEILTEDKKAKNNAMLLQTFKQKLEQLYTPQAKSKDIDFRVEVAPSADVLSIPQNKMMQIAGNLISNAIKFTPKSGTVVATLNTTKNDTENTLQITVSDTGQGIKQAQIELLLSDNTDSSDGTDGEKGYGFGLALVKHLVKGLNGTLNIVSTHHQGSKFIVSMPIASH